MDGVIEVAFYIENFIRKPLRDKFLMFYPKTLQYIQYALGNIK